MGATVKPWHDGGWGERTAHLKSCSSYQAPRPQRTIAPPHNLPPHCLPARHALPAFVMPWHDGVMGERTAHLKPCPSYQAPRPQRTIAPPRCLPAALSPRTARPPRFRHAVASRHTSASKLRFQALSCSNFRCRARSGSPAQNQPKIYPTNYTTKCSRQPVKHLNKNAEPK